MNETNDELDDTHAEQELVVVYETSEPDVLPVIESILQAAEIPFTVANEGLMNLFPSDAAASSTLSKVSQVQILVTAERAEDAKALLAEDFTLSEQPAELAEGGD